MRHVGPAICLAFFPRAGEATTFVLKHVGMADDDLANEIARLEAEIERLAGVAEGCRKLVLVSKVAIAIGAMVLVTSFAGLIRFDQLIMIVSIVAVLGGIVGLGSNNTTLRQALADATEADALRSELIGRIDMKVVTDAARPSAHAAAEPLLSSAGSRDQRSFGSAARNGNGPG
jgi:hypothetical protein